MLKIAGIQLITNEDKDSNIEKAKNLVGVASDKGAKIICLPELFNTRWFPRDINPDNFKLAEDEAGHTLNVMKDTARRKKVVLVCPIFEKDGDDYYNTAFVIDEHGEVIGKYRKVHVPQLPFWEERSYFKPGNLGFPVFDTKYAKVGIQICWDNFFPEGSRILALKGAEIIFAPTASAFSHSHERWERAMAVNAHMNGIFIFRLNRIGRESRQEFYGRSFCVGPDGEFIDKPSGQSDGVVIVSINLKAIDVIRQDWAFFKDRRPDQYGEIIKK
ncbi:MAG: acyltransferase [Deltaproteobacteria bacterium]|nr:acyltransferase [Deltaproteobacteria bacterium]